MKIQGSMQHSFAQVPNAEIQRSSFDRSHGYKTTFDAGLLVPFFVDEALPGDSFNLSMTGFARMATPIFPIMDNLYMETFFFAVPYRLLWENWERFCGAQTNPGDSTDFVLPKVAAPSGGQAAGYQVHSVADYMGVPPLVPNLVVSALPVRAYALIWNEWFRDQNLQDTIEIPLDDGPDDPLGVGGVFGFYSLPMNRNKRHDYFTSCLPWPQKGDSVELPLGTAAPVIGGSIVPLGDGQPQFTLTSGSGLIAERVWGSNGSQFWGFDSPADVTAPIEWAFPKLQLDGATVDLSAATAATINQLRQAFQIQKMLERDARGGTRYTEVVRAHFGVTSPDARLQRPEYLGGGSSMVTISPVAQTSSTVAGSPQATLSAFGTATLHGHGFSKSFTEHCVIIGMVAVRADLTYQQSLNRMWSRDTRYDMFWPALANIGEQVVLRRELHVVGDASDDLVFGFQERFAEYRYKPSLITGLFRSNVPGSLDVWHLAQDFGPDASPALSNPFITDEPPVDRVIAVPDEPHFLFDAHFSLRCARPMPMFGVPGLIDHF